MYVHMSLLTDAGGCFNFSYFTITIKVQVKGDDLLEILILLIQGITEFLLKLYIVI